MVCMVVNHLLVKIIQTGKITMLGPKCVWGCLDKKEPSSQVWQPLILETEALLQPRATVMRHCEACTRD